MKVKEVQANIKAITEQITATEREYKDLVKEKRAKMQDIYAEAKKDRIYNNLRETAADVHKLQKDTEKRYRTWKLTAYDDWDVDFEDLEVEKRLSGYVQELENLCHRINRDFRNRLEELPMYRTAQILQEQIKEKIKTKEDLYSQLRKAYSNMLLTEDLPVEQSIIAKVYEKWSGKPMSNDDFPYVNVEDDETVTFRVPEIAEFSINTKGECYEDLRDHPDWCLSKVCQDVAESVEDLIESVLPKNYKVYVWVDDEDIENIEDINIEGSTNKDGNYMGRYNISYGFECVIEIRK